MAIIYKHEYLPISVYGNIVSLLREQGAREGVHIDLGCGYGAIAEPVRDELKRDYIGFDLAQDGLDSLRERGFEVHLINLSDLDEVEKTIRAALRGRKVATLTFGDVLEHVTNGEDILSMLSRLAASDDARLVLSVPNVAHKDIALKLLLGRWDMTEAGLLDHTHVNFYNKPRLDNIMERQGWQEVGAKDWLLEQSDQHFPSDFPIFNIKTPAGHFIRTLIDRANPYALVNQFVRSYRLGRSKQTTVPPSISTGTYLLSVFLIFDPADLQPILDLVRELDGQTDQNFELVLIPCREIIPNISGGVIDRLDISRALADRTTIGRSGAASVHDAFNAAIRSVTGVYISILRPFDRISQDWVSTFRELDDRSRGVVLRAVREEPVLPASHEALLPEVPTVFSEFRTGRPPSIAEVAIPRKVLINYGIQFDPELKGAAEFELVTQAAMLCGITMSNTVTVRSTSAKPDAEISEEDNLQVLSRLNGRPILLPPGAAERIQRLIREKCWFQEQNEKLLAELGELAEFFAHAPQLTDLINRHRPGLVSRAGRVAPADDGASPFISIITRTQGKRARTLRDVLMTLAGQSCPAFELILVVHSQDETRVQATRDIIEEFPRTLQDRVVVMHCKRPGRSAPINDALEVAKGDYFSVLDDDDFVFGHWVETFRNLACESPGSVLRTVCTLQKYEMALSGEGEQRPRATSWFKMEWPATYDPLRHLYENLSPFMTIAFPLGAFRRLGFRFDESLTTAEDWDLTTRMIMLCGVRTSPEVTAIYRWWTNGESSLFLHKPEQWVANRQYVLDRLDERPIVLAPGAVRSLVALYDDQTALRASLEDASQSQDKLLQEIKNASIYQANLERQIESTRAHLAELEREDESVGSSRAQLEREVESASLSRNQLEREVGRLQIRMSMDKMARKRASTEANNAAASLLRLELNKRRFVFGHEARNSERITRLMIEVLDSGLFDRTWYLERYEDVRSDGMDPLLHFAVHGMKEGRDPGPDFDGTYYLELYPDVAASDMSPFLHYLRHGLSEGRRCANSD